MDITQGDLKFYKEKLFKDKNFHEKEFLQRIDPDRIDLYYEGNPDGNNDDAKPDRISINSIFPATSTLVAQFYPQNPKFVGIPKRDGDELAAKIAASAMDYYYEQMNAVAENQKAIISSWMYGFGVTKQGWRTVFRQPTPVKVNQDQGLYGKIKEFFTGTPNIEEQKTNEYIASDGPFLEFVNSKNIYFDSEQPLGKGRVMHQYIPKCLYELRNSSLYDVNDDFFNKFRRGGKDERESIVDLYESWWWLDDALYVLVTVDGWNKPLRWDKTPYTAEGFPYKVLTLNTQVNRIYPVSHMKVAQRLNRIVDYISTLQKEHIEKHKNITVFDGDAFDKDDMARIKKNEIGFNVFTKNSRPASMAANHVGGNTIPQEMFAVSDILRGNIKEILTVVGARMGQSEEETATQERIVDFGNQLRATGMTSQIRDFLISQGKKLLQDMKQFATSKSLFKITGLNLIDPVNGQLITDKWVEFATQNNPELLRDIIPAEMDIGLDVTNRSRRDMPIMRKQLSEFVQTVVMPMAPLLAQEGKKFNAYRFVKDMAENFETIENADKYFDSVPVPGIMPQGVPPVGPQGQPPVEAPNPEQGVALPPQV